MAWLQKSQIQLYREHLPIIFSIAKLCGRSGVQMIVGRRKPLNPANIGKEYWGKSVRVTADKIALFAQATNDDNPLYIGGVKNQERVAPPMFLGHFMVYSLTKLFSDPDLNLDFTGMFHAGQDMEFFRPLRVGEEVSTHSFVKKIVDKGKGEILVTNTVVRTSEGEIVGKGYSSWYVRKPKKLWTEKEEEFREQLYWEPPEGHAVRLIDQVEVAPDQTIRYAKISGDYNLVHISDLVAKMLGEGKRILQGMCTMSFVARALVNNLLGGDPQRLKRLNLRFLSNVKAGDVLETYGWAIDPKETRWASFWMDPEDSSASLWGFKTVNQDGKAVVSRGVAKMTGPISDPARAWPRRPG